MATTETPQIKSVVYCQVCTLPVEYCEFGGTIKACKEWLKNNHEDVYNRLYAVDSLSADMKDKLGVSGAASADEVSTKETRRAEREAAKRLASKVIIKIVERTRRKRVTTVRGLDIFGVETKKAAKMMANKFATGASVTKSGDGKDEIVIQGDLGYDVQEFIEEKFKEVPADNIDVVEDTKSKKK
ncbi:translation initiation factor [Schizosaccharomyces japonicus yFS275]|uniref:Translation machinery-associated protein 22 n=1 Tax=Schizosaccharomyces japonicus (strain yFS275 / FY16936) TaxID=402676 RepID=B6JY28_SCHJY|nr:translation initiation factor [Schizosaccharomyces japonicus yFS275]EEB06446.1 translation initiation factor [Schizosaccharomyces japonicus yFS275]